MSQTRKLKKQQKNLVCNRGRLVRQYPSLTNVPFTQFASLDEEVVIEKHLPEKDATGEALEAVQPDESQASHEDQVSDTDNDEICVI